MDILSALYTARRQLGLAQYSMVALLLPPKNPNHEGCVVVVVLVGCREGEPGPTSARGEELLVVVRGRSKSDARSATLREFARSFACRAVSSDHFCAGIASSRPPSSSLPNFDGMFASEVELIFINTHNWRMLDPCTTSSSKMSRWCVTRCTINESCRRCCLLQFWQGARVDCQSTSKFDWIRGIEADWLCVRDYSLLIFQLTLFCYIKQYITSLLVCKLCYSVWYRYDLHTRQSTTDGASQGQTQSLGLQHADHDYHLWVTPYNYLLR